MLIGLCGRAGAGKTTVAKHLVCHGFKEFTFAEPLKRICARISGISYEILLGETPETRLQRETIKDPVWGLTGREWLETIGTDVMRKHFDADVWYKILMRDCAQELQHGNIVITDCRFLNEYEGIKKMGGKVIVLYRNESELMITENDKDTCISKWGFLNFINAEDIHLKNNGSIKTLLDEIINIINKDSQYDCVSIP